jgi:hypothetical protein
MEDSSDSIIAAWRHAGETKDLAEAMKCLAE